MNHLKKDLEDFDFLLDGLQDGSVKYIGTSDELFSKIITSFPITANRIDWDLIPHFSHSVLEKYPESQKVISSLIAEIIENKCLNKDEEVSICFDGYTKGVFVMKLELLMQFSGEIFTLPQHTYVIPNNVGWCINYSFEDILYFGFSVR